MNRLSATIILLITIFPAIYAATPDSIPSGFRCPAEWHIWAETAAGYVPETRNFLRGENPYGKDIKWSVAGSVRAGFSFNGNSREGILYKGVYQGIGVGVNSFFANDVLGTPVSAFVYQGAPIFHLSRTLRLGYEWQFGAAFGWRRQDAQIPENNGVVSTNVTAHMGLGIKLHFSPSERWDLSFGMQATHFSNGNTSWPNSGVNSVGATLGIAYTLTPQPHETTDCGALEEIADRGEWLYDITGYAAWRKRIVRVGNPPEPVLCPGKFGVVGLLFSPLRRLNRWVAVGPALDLQWDESAGLEQHWVEGTSNETIKFERPPFSEQLSVGLSAHAELTMPIFSVNAGLGYNIKNPEGDCRFYQSLTLKTFIAKNVYLNVGYRLGNFKNPQNLMLGFGVRL